MFTHTVLPSPPGERHLQPLYAQQHVTRPTLPAEVLEDQTGGKANWHWEKVEVWLQHFFTIDNPLYYFFLRDPTFWEISAYQATKQMLLAQGHLIHLPVPLLVKDISNQLLSC